MKWFLSPKYRVSLSSNGLVPIKSVSIEAAACSLRSFTAHLPAKVATARCNSSHVVTLLPNDREVQMLCFAGLTSSIGKQEVPFSSACTFAPVMCRCLRTQGAEAAARLGAVVIPALEHRCSHLNAKRLGLLRPGNNAAIIIREHYHRASA